MAREVNSQHVKFKKTGLLITFIIKSTIEYMKSVIFKVFRV